MVPGPPGPSWRPWGTDAFLLAQRTRRPVLLVLFDAWSPAWAGLAQGLARAAAVPGGVGQRAVLIAVERDLRPDIADRYAPGGGMAAVVLDPLGWPLATAPLVRADALDALLDRAAAATDGVATDGAATDAAATDGVATDAADASAYDTPAGSWPWTDAIESVASALAAAIDETTGMWATTPSGAEAVATLDHAHGWIPEVVLAVAARPVDADGDPWAGPLLARVFEGPMWDDAAGACRRIVDGVVVDVRLTDDNARWLLALAVAARAGTLDRLAPRLPQLARWMARQQVASPAPGLRAWDAAPAGRPVDVEASLRGTRAWMHAAEVLGDEDGLARAIDLFDAVASASLGQGAGIARALTPRPVLRGFLSPQIAASAAALDAAAASGREAYLDLADEVLRNAVAKLWHEGAGLFVDRVATSAGAGDVGPLPEPRAPYEANLEAAATLARLALSRGDRQWLERARRIASALVDTALASGVGAAAWLTAAREVDRAAAQIGPS